MEKNLLKTHLKHLEQFDKQRIIWLRLSAFVVFAILGIIWDWGTIQTLHLGWWFGAAGLVISVLWWYWTMIVIRMLIQYRSEEAELLYEIVDDIKSIKKEVTKT